MALNSLRPLWEQIKAQAVPHRSGLELRRVTQASERALFAGYRMPENKFISTLRISKGALPSAGRLPKIGGVEVFVAVDSNAVHFGLMLRDERNFDLFDTFCRDLVTYLAPLTSDSAAVTAFLGRLQLWQKFLERGGEGLSEGAEQGLWGELFFLRAHLQPVFGEASLVWWKGPQGTAQDFECGTWAVEIKTVDQAALVTKISSEWQLDGTSWERLFLFCLRLKDDMDGETLPQIVESLRSLEWSQQQRDLLEDRLLEAGYFDIHAERYVGHHFAPVGQHLFEVRGNFPCLTPQNLPSGLSHVSYNLELSSCRSFECAFGTLRDFLFLP